MSIVQSIKAVVEKPSSCSYICLDAMSSINHHNAADLSSESLGLWNLPLVGDISPHSHKVVHFFFFFFVVRDKFLWIFKPNHQYGPLSNASPPTLMFPHYVDFSVSWRRGSKAMATGMHTFLGRQQRKFTPNFQQGGLDG